MLPTWEQKTILHLHKSLGHPSNDRLAKALQVNGSRPDMVQAARELKCTACAINAPPKHARTAALKSLMDFNHKIYLDGISWTNHEGTEYFFYHILDAGSHYHVALAAPRHNTEALTNLLERHWLSWAGPPKVLSVDAGTEMNSHEFQRFAQET